MSIANTIPRLRFYLQRHGLRATLKRAALGLRRDLFPNWMMLFYSELADADSWPADFPPTLRVERKRSKAELDPRDLEAISKHENLGRLEEDWKKRFDRGATLWLFRLGDDLFGYEWSLWGGTMEPYFFPLGPKEVHLFDAFVLPHYRGRKLQTVMRTYILKMLALEGATRSFGEAAEWNQASLSSVKKSSFRPFYGRAKIWTLPRHTVVCWDRSCQAAGLESTKKQPAGDGAEAAGKLFRRLAQFAYFLRRHGLLATLRRAATAGRRALTFRRFHVTGNDLAEFLGQMPELPPGLAVERIQSESELASQDLQELLHHENPELVRRKLKERFARGASLWLLKQEGKPAGYEWSLRGGSLEPYFFPILPDDVHMFDTLIFPECRGRGLDRHLKAYILASLAAERGGRGRALGDVAAWNKAQLSNLSKSRRRRLGTARKFRFFGRTMVIWDGHPGLRQEPAGATLVEQRESASAGAATRRG